MEYCSDGRMRAGLCPSQLKVRCTVNGNQHEACNAAVLCGMRIWAPLGIKGNGTAGAEVLPRPCAGRPSHSGQRKALLSTAQHSFLPSQSKITTLQQHNSPLFSQTGSTRALRAEGPMCSQLKNPQAGSQGSSLGRWLW